MSLKGTLEYAKLSITGFKAEVLLSEKLIDAIISELDKVEEMQKALEWYADEKNYDVFEINTEEQGIIVMTEYWTNVTKDEGERARQALKGESQ